jgi:hypothetical protein
MLFCPDNMIFDVWTPLVNTVRKIKKNRTGDSQFVFHPFPPFPYEKRSEGVLSGTVRESPLVSPFFFLPPDAVPRAAHGEGYRSQVECPAAGEEEEMDMGSGTLWSAHAADLIEWFEQRRAELPATSFLLNAWTSVSTPVNFYAALGRDIAQGPQSTRAAALVGDLEDLFAWWSREHRARDLHSC